MIGWKNTRSALEKLEELLTCKVCANLVSDPCSLEACDHIFCRKCVEKLVGADSKCPECGAFAWVKDLKTNRQLANTVSMCTKIRMLVESDDDQGSGSGDDDDDDNNVKGIPDKPETRMIWEETQSIFDQETDSYQFSSPDIVIPVKAMNKCDGAVQEISCNNKKKSKEPAQIKTYSRKTRMITAAKKASNGEEIIKQGLCRELGDQDSGNFAANEILASGQRTKEIVPASSSGSSKGEKRAQARKKCFGKHLQKTRLIKKTCPVFTENGDHENEEQNDHMFIEIFDTVQFKVTDDHKGRDVADEEKHKENTKPFTRLRSKGSGTSGGLVMMQDNGPLHKGFLKAVESTPRTRAQKRNLRGTPQRSSLKTLPQNKPEKGLTNERIISEQLPMKKKKTEATKETPLKSQGNRKRKMSEKNLCSPKNSTLCPPEVKRNKRGETPLHVAAIKGCVETARKLLAEGADPNTKDHAGWTPLHEACNHGYLTITELLLDHGAMINTPGGFDHDAPLHDAVANRRVQVVRLLISRGAALNVRNKQGLLPIDYAATKELVSILSTSTSNKEIGSSTTVPPLPDVKGLSDSHKVLLATGLSSEQKVNIQKCVRILNASLVNEFSLSVTHIVTATNTKGVCPRTLKYLNGVLTGKWIVKYQWILESLQKKTWVDETPFEVKGTSDAATDAPKRARINSLQQLPSLFDGCQFFFSGEFVPPHPSKEDLVQLVKHGGGRLLSREPKPDIDGSLCLPRTPESNKAPVTLAPVAYHANPTTKHYRCAQYIIYDSLAEKRPHIWDTESVCSMPSTWLMDCASNFQILTLE